MSIFDSSQETQTQPWKYAAPYLKGMMPTIAGLQTPEYYGGDLTAGLSPGMESTLAGMYGFGGPSGMGGQAASALYGAGTPLLGGYGEAQDYLNQMANTATPQFQFDQGTFDTIMGNLAPGMQNLFDVNARNAQQQFDFNVLPGLNMEASAAGGYGGTKALQQSALGQAMNAANIQNLGADIWQNAANTAIGGGMTGGLQNLQQENLRDRQLLGGYMGLGGAGADLMGTAYDMGRGNLGLGYQAGTFENLYDQSAIDREIARHQFNQAAPWEAERNRLNMFMQPAQAFSTRTTTDSPSTFSNIMQGVGALGSFAMGMPGLGNIMNPVLGSGGYGGAGSVFGRLGTEADLERMMGGDLF